MGYSRGEKYFITILIYVIALCSIIVGGGLGMLHASNRHVEEANMLRDFQPSLPSTLLDIHGNVITEFFAEQKRDLIPVDELPKELVYAIITREDKNFFLHHGFSFKGTARAAVNILLNRYVSGGSTITQQVAGALYSDRSQKTIKRKLKELWWAFQFEKSLTKNEILERYLNESYFGHGTYGVEAASQFYFNHSVRNISLAESAILVIQLANPARYSPIKHPNRARVIQREVLDQIVEANYASQEQADISYELYWNDIYDQRRSGSDNANLVKNKNDKAPYFSEYIRQELENMLYGKMDYLRDGLIIHSTLDLSYQTIADGQMNENIKKINSRYHEESTDRTSAVDEEFVPIVEALALMYDIRSIHTSGIQQKKHSIRHFQDDITPILGTVSLLFDCEPIDYISQYSYSKGEAKLKKTTVEGALIVLENETGHIKAMVGGSDFQEKKFNRATQAKVMPGSSFKPLYYSAAISSGIITPATILQDRPIAYKTDNGSLYTPLNFLGTWDGTVSVRTALSKSMNVPSIEVLDKIGFDAAINRASRLLGITDPEQIRKTFPRVYPLGLGIIDVAPISMARAFATFANQGREVVPIGIRYIEDRNGQILFEPEKELRVIQNEDGNRRQILSPQAAYIMVDLLKSTVETGTLANRRRQIGGFPMPFAGKTGTTQNWSDAWTVGFSPYLTTAVWFGFDEHGNSLGLNQTGAVAAGPVWAKVMKEIHLADAKNLPPADFIRPGGLTEVTVCEKSGMLPTADCTDGQRREIFIMGTEPKNFCTVHKAEKELKEERIQQFKNNLFDYF